MPKVKISEYSATANSNTDVASINIDEGCAPSGINNAIRAVMGHLKDFQQGTYGDPFNGPVNGALNGTVGATTPNTGAFTTLSATGNVTLGDASTDTLNVGNGGLIKDASGNVGIGTSSPASGYRLTVGDGSTSTDGAMVLNGGTSTNNGAGIAFRRGGTSKGFIGTQSWVTSGTSDNIVLYAGVSNALLFYTDGASAMNLSTNGALALKGASTSATGVGITFPATQSASSDANTLDDYEEGTYTVTLTPQTSGTITLSGTVNEGAYTKVGRVVTITAQVEIGSVSSPNGSYIDFSIPFAIANLTDNAGRVYFAGVYQQGGAPFTTSINRVLGIETFSTVRFYITAATVAAGDELGIAFSYFTD